MGMVVSVTSLRETPGQSRPFSFRSEARDVGAALSVTFLGAVAVAGEISYTGSGYRVAGRIDYRKRFVCDRCLKETVADDVVEFCETFCRRAAEDVAPEGDGEEPDAYFTGDAIDLESLVRDALLLAQPITNLCKPDCRGLCSRCGHDLNFGDCGCDRQVVDPRLAALADFFDK